MKPKEDELFVLSIYNNNDNDIDTRHTNTYKNLTYAT